MTEANDPTGPDDISYEIDIEKGIPSDNGDISYGPVTFYRKRNPNGIAPELHREGEGTYLRLAVAKNAFTHATSGSPDSCDRCELRDTKLQLGTPVWYSFDIRAERGFPIADARFVCAQIKAPFYDADGGSPLFALRIDRGRYTATVEHLYEAKDVKYVDGSEVSRYVTRYGADWCFRSVRAFDHHIFPNSPTDAKELQIRALFATYTRELPPHVLDEFQSCTKGVTVERKNPLPDDIYRWWRFKLCVAPTSVKDMDGIVQLYVRDPGGGQERLVATAQGEFGHVGYSDAAINTGPVPGQAEQYFKIGPYRDKFRIWGDAT